jgi:hypothetical protein
MAIRFSLNDRTCPTGAIRKFGSNNELLSMALDHAAVTKDAEYNT